jgi:hypothetical protein
MEFKILTQGAGNIGIKFVAAIVSHCLPYKTTAYANWDFFHHNVD